MANTLPANDEPRFFRDLRHFNENAFHQDLLAVDFKGLISNDISESISTILDNLRAIQTVMLLYVKHQNGNECV